MDKDAVRRLFPSVIAFADECRDEFGEGVKLVYAKENGREIGCEQPPLENGFRQRQITLGCNHLLKDKPPCGIRMGPLYSDHDYKSNNRTREEAKKRRIRTSQQYANHI